MPEYLSPGVYVEEISTGPRPIEGVGTSTAGFVGAAERGPENARLITSWLDFQRWYGGYAPDISYLAYAVQGYFQNGGQRCFVTRIVAEDGANNGANAAIANSGALGNLALTAVGRGAWGNRIFIKVDPATQSNAQPNWFRMSVAYFRAVPANLVDPFSTATADLTNPNRREPDVAEVFDNLSVVPGASNNVETVLNSSSRLLRANWAGAQQRPADQAIAALGNAGADGAALTVADYIGDMDAIGARPDELLGRGRGLAALAAVDDIAILLAPDEVHSGLGLGLPLTQAVIQQCELLKDRFGVVSAAQGQSGPPAGFRPPQDSLYAAFYYPWIRIFDPTINWTRLIPPSGHVAGIMARTDIERGVHKAPANEVVRGALDLEFPVPKGMQDVLNPVGVNCIRDFRADGRGIRLWGARTMSSDPMWKYVNVRRLFIFVEESIDQGTQWVVFEPNDDTTWAAVRRTITNFLTSVWRSGALMGLTPDEAFFVRCDRSTMTQDDIDNGRLICYIGIAPVKPAEFVIFRISQKTADAES